MLADLDALRIAARALSLAEFVAAHPTPALVLRPFVVEAEASLATFARGPGGDETMLAKVEKRPEANPFKMMITLGRSANNDVVLPSSSVSKFHAYFRQVQGRWSLTDGGSTLGTFVGTRRLKATLDQVALASRDELRFGELAATFFLPADVHAWLRGELDPGSAGPAT